MAANTYDVYDVTIEKRYDIGKNEKYPIVLCTPGGNYVGYSAKLILDFLNKGEMSRLEQGIDDMQTLYMLYMVEVCKQDNLRRENENLKEELEFVRGDNTKFEEDVKQLKNDLEESQRNNIELAADVKALEVRFDIVSAASIGFRKDIQKLQEENDKLRQENKEISDNIKKLRTQCSTSVGQRNKYYELYKQLMVENRRLLQKQAWSESQLHILNTINNGYTEDTDKLKQENEELKKKLIVAIELRKEISHEWCELDATCMALTKERDDLQKQNEYLSGSIEKICDIHMKEKAELKKQLEASSDLTMANELADIFAEYTVADQKNRDDLGDKITEFRRKYGLE